MAEEIELAICLGAQMVQLIAEAVGGGSQRAKTSRYLRGRQSKGRFAKDFQDLTQNERLFKENFRMDVETFNKLFDLLLPFLQPKRNTRPKDAIPPKEKLAIVLEYYACGTLQRHVSSVYRISKQHFGIILEQVSVALCQALKGEMPEMTADDMLAKASQFEERWNLPNCVGAVDGKHVAIRCPQSSGSLFYNYKGFFSVVLMAVADARYKFAHVDIGAYGSEGDASVFAGSSLGAGLFEGTLEFPPNRTVGPHALPFFFIGDDAFPLHERMMKPYVPPKSRQLTKEEAIYNYRLSRARRCVENAFGIMCSRFYCLARTMICGPDKAQKIIAACCYLHNFLISQNKTDYCPPNYTDSYDSCGQVIPGDFRTNIPENSMFNSEYEATHLGNYPMQAKEVREKLKNFVNSSIGCVAWQVKAAHFD